MPLHRDGCWALWLTRASSSCSHSEDRSQPAFPSEHRKFGNPCKLHTLPPIVEVLHRPTRGPNDALVECILTLFLSAPLGLAAFSLTTFFLVRILCSVISFIPSSDMLPSYSLLQCSPSSTPERIRSQLPMPCWAWLSFTVVLFRSVFPKASGAFFHAEAVYSPDPCGNVFVPALTNSSSLSLAHFLLWSSRGNGCGTDFWCHRVHIL